MFVFLLYEWYTFRTISSPASAMEYWSRAQSMKKVNCTLVKNLCVIHHSLWSTLFCLQIARISRNLQIWSFCGKGNATNVNTSKNKVQLQTRKASSKGQNLDYDEDIIRDSHLQVCLLRHHDRRHSEEARAKWIEKRIHVWGVDCCCRRWCRCCFMRKPGFTRIVKATVSRCTLEDSSSFQRCSNLCEPYSWFSTLGCEDSQQRLSKFSFFSRNNEP